MLDEKELIELSENGKNEVVQLSVKGKSAVIVISFDRIRKALALLLDTQISGEGKNAKVSVKIDPIGAGDFLLFQCWNSGDEELRTKTRLRMQAAKQLGEWLQKLQDEEDDDGSEKKS